MQQPELESASEEEADALGLGGLHGLPSISQPTPSHHQLPQPGPHFALSSNFVSLLIGNSKYSSLVDMFV